ncbi:ESPR-type extended signal peptide-containing protein [Azotobacter chroococcum]
MNRIFNVIWSHTQSAWVVTSEHAAKRGKPGRLRLSIIVLCLSPLSCWPPTCPRADRSSWVTAESAHPRATTCRSSRTARKWPSTGRASTSARTRA